MKRIFLLLCVFLFANFCRAQLLSWAPEFLKDNDDVTVTVDATKGNQVLLGFAGNVYVHIGAITNLSAGPINWRYSKGLHKVKLDKSERKNFSPGIYLLRISLKNSA